MTPLIDAPAVLCRAVWELKQAADKKKEKDPYINDAFHFACILFPIEMANIILGGEKCL